MPLSSEYAGRYSLDIGYAGTAALVRSWDTGSRAWCLLTDFLRAGAI